MSRVFVFLLFTIYCTLTNAQALKYKVTKIKLVGDYYVIYAAKNDSIYKIVSKKEKIHDCRKIMKSQNYLLNLTKIQILGGSEVDCVSFSRRTIICKEPDVDLYFATNLKGLCIIEK